MNAQVSTAADPFFQFKQAQKQGWSHFAPLEALTIPPAAQLVRYAQVDSGDRVLDVACGTGVVSITAARIGAKVTGLDLTPELLQRARQNAAVSEVQVEFHEGDAERLPFDDSSFDVVLSQFGHIFAPRPEVATSELLRVLKPGGTVAFAAWPPEFYVGRSSALVMKYMPPPAVDVPSPFLWGDPSVVRQRLGNRVKDILFHSARMNVPALTPQLHRTNVERTVGSMVKLVEVLSASDPAKLQEFRKESEALAAEYIEGNVLRQDYLLTRAKKL